MSELPTRVPRKRLTREESKALTRARLLESAQALFALKGYEGTSVDEISRDAGYTRGAFYANFANKEAVMAELIRGGFEGDLAALERFSRPENNDHAAEIYSEIARRFYGSPESTLWMLEFQLACVRHPELRRDYADQFDRLRRSVAGIVRETYRAQGRAEPEQAERFADAFIAVLSGMSLIKILDPEKIDDDLFADTFRALVTGIAAVVWDGKGPGR